MSCAWNETSTLPTCIAVSFQFEHDPDEMAM
jgi:hypothetical protein